MSHLDVLVCGAGIAGSTLAFWLGRTGARVTIIERAPEIRNAGLGVDVRGPAVEVIRRMGLEDQIRRRTTGEEGLAFVDSQDRSFAHFGIDKENLERSPTSDIEIMRSDLAQLITTAALDDQHVKIKYATCVETVTQDENKVSVRYTNGKSANFDLVIAADGLGSTTRKLLLGEESVARSRQEIEGQPHVSDQQPTRGLFTTESNSPGPVYSIGQYTAYFSIPREERDGMLWKWYTAPGRRMLSTRPKNAAMSCAYLSIMPKDEARLPELMKQSITEQKKGLTSLFEGAGWQTSRLLTAMQDAPDFYLQHIPQVKLPTWHSGRCVVVGDAAYCPSPLSGVGTSLAILGAYVLAGEIATSKNDHAAAFQTYEQKLRPYVERMQKLYPGVPGIANPASAWGVSVLNWVIWFVAWSGVLKWFGSSSSGKDNGFIISDCRFE